MDELERLRKENDSLRNYIANSSLNCIYCGLSKAEMIKCSFGFPGCGRADDMMYGEEYSAMEIKET